MRAFLTGFSGSRARFARHAAHGSAPEHESGSGTFEATSCPVRVTPSRPRRARPLVEIDAHREHVSSCGQAAQQDAVESVAGPPAAELSVTGPGVVFWRWIRGA